MLASLRRLSRKRPLRLLQVEPTMRCNLRCVMCPWTGPRSGGGDMDWATFQRIVPYLEDADGLDLTGGGEPLMHPRLPEMVAAGKTAHCTVGFSTNGVLLGPQALSDLLAARLDWIAFSIDAAEPATYAAIRQGASLDVVLQNVARVMAAGRGAPSVSFFFVMMRQNVHELPALIRLAHDLGVRQVVAKNLDVVLKEGDEALALIEGDGVPPYQAARWLALAHEEADRLHVRFRAYSLEAREAVVCEQDPLRTAFVNWEGWVSPCITLCYARRSWWGGAWQPVERQRWGNVNAAALPDILASPPASDFLSIYRSRQRAWLAGAVAAAGSHDDELPDLPPAPEACRRCGYLYGV